MLKVNAQCSWDRNVILFTRCSGKAQVEYNPPVVVPQNTAFKYNTINGFL